jgi:Mtf2 family
MLTRNVLGRQSRHVTLQTAAATKPKSNDLWGQIFDELPQSPAYSSLLSNRVVKKLSQKDYFTKNRTSGSKFFSRNPFGGARSFSTSARRDYAREKTSTSAGSISMSGWGHVFHDFEKTPFVTPAKQPDTFGEGPLKHPIRRQSMTPREISAFDDMFNMLFNAIAPKTQQSNHQTTASPVDPSVGYTNYKEKMKWRIPRALTAEEEALLDEKKEEMELCYSDFDLLQWAEQELFADSIERLRKFEQRQRELNHSALNPKILKSISPSSSFPPSSPAEEIQNPLYAPMLANLMNIAMHKFGNTQLACTLFLHAANLSFPSFIHACTTASFNIYLEALWSGMKDLRAVFEAVEEMHRLGIKRDNTTRSVVGKIRRDLEDTLRKASSLLNNLTISGQRQIGFLDEEEIFIHLERMDKLCAEDPSDLFFSSEAPASLPAWKEEWKSSIADSADQTQTQVQPMDDGLEDIGDAVFKPEVTNNEGSKTKDDSWAFDDWNMPTLSSDILNGTGLESGRNVRPRKQLTHHFGAKSSSSDQRMRSMW